MAEAAQRVLGADVGIAATGVAGPTEQDGVAVGTVFFGIALPGLPTEAVSTRLPGDRERLRQFSTISLLNLLRQRLDVLDDAMIEVQVNIDCADAVALRSFYCAALGYGPHGEAGQYTSCVPGEGATGPKIVFQQVPEAKFVKNRVHLDLVVDDIEAEGCARIALGATRVSTEPVCEADECWIVMLDPEGNEICLCAS